MTNRNGARQIVNRRAELNTNETNESEKVIEGYFAVFNSETELFPGAFEEILPGAFDNTLDNDVRALINHDTALVLGRSISETLSLRVDDTGLWGQIKINTLDTDAINLYERVKRGDVSQCSFGFNIIKEQEEWREDGSVKWSLQEVELHEVSVCTFPAYSDTSVEARQNDVKKYEQRKLEAKKNQLKERLKLWH
ncbi:HK97 family phage prohead protease [Listeria monocytogenes]|uniref:HK97 family phage prohead protease n=1 Tax=Listeria monocytogenes TaxID=1639 RepID=UPI000E6BF6F3|nr:HK97 family phage prohead protease [Listeria monocytogenes]EAC7787664.1 HK97 family phage prohead protease [Listeria monocytogenes]EAC9723649.1 HK97 family phage prohead protease [Listeria monocytogenes]EAD3226260.1 HK97 family phage prohead protease [Listeria monocytogenes]EAD9223135.1 HK97 family phage prohead protease [Listeria monocytogenes]EAD9552131.1 HK97 family phage prohead protease [Listeria monocytogenes]